MTVAVQWAIHEGGCQTQETGLPAATSEGRKGEGFERFVLAHSMLGKFSI